MNSLPPDGYLSSPSADIGPGVLVLHAWWGLNDTLKAFCDRLSKEGFSAFAPDLYHGRVADTIPEAEKLGHELDGSFLQAKAEIQEAARSLANLTRPASPTLSVAAFSMGVYYALDLAAAFPNLVRKVVIFYGTGDGDYRSSQAEYLGHFASNDQFEPQENVDRLEHSLAQAGRTVTFHRYPGTGHWFFEPDRIDAYNPAAAALAWKRTLEFLKKTAETGSPQDPGNRD